jgi:SNF2 family DNA or RNA helicase
MSAQATQENPLFELSKKPIWSTERVLQTLDVVFRNQLTSESPKATQPPHIKLPLRDHQLALLAAMEMRENQGVTGIQYKNTTTYSRYGILGDEVGSGKSLVVLSYIAAMKNKNPYTQIQNLFPDSRGDLFSVYTTTLQTTVNSSLIIVPHTIYRQWQTYCKEHTNLNIFYAKSAKDISALMDSPSWADISGNVGGKTKRAELIEKLNQSDAVLVSNTLYATLEYYAEHNNISWKRVFIDEADTMYISGTARPTHAPFTWFITATWPNFLMVGHCIRPLMMTFYNQNATEYSPALGEWLGSEIGPVSAGGVGRITWFNVRSKRWFEPYYTQHVLRGLTVLMCSKEFLSTSRKMPLTQYTTLMCEQPATHRVLAGFVNANIQNMLHAGNVDGALAELGVNADTPMNLVEAVTHEREKELDRLKKTLAFKQTIDYATPQAKEAALASLIGKIASVESQLTTFKERLTATTIEDCPICYDDPKQNSATMTPCCHRIFCGACILQSLTRGLTCPMCRAQIKTGELVQLVDESKTKKKKAKDDASKLLSKPRQLLKFLKENPEARVLVFSRYDNPFLALERDCDSEGISYHTLRGNKDVIASTIKSFEKGEKRVLFLPTESAGAGLNLVSASHIVLFHAMTPEEEKQAVGRAYRLGRTEPLSVIRLLHEGETVMTQQS